MDQSVNGKTLDVKRKTQTRNVIPSAVEGSIHEAKILKRGSNCHLDRSPMDVAERSIHEEVIMDYRL